MSQCPTSSPSASWVLWSWAERAKPCNPPLQAGQAGLCSPVQWGVLASDIPSDTSERQEFRSSRCYLFPNLVHLYRVMLEYEIELSACSPGVISDLSCTLHSKLKNKMKIWSMWMGKGAQAATEDILLMALAPFWLGGELCKDTVGLFSFQH